MNGQAPAGRAGFRTGLGRSARLFLAFRTEQADPAGFYTLVAADAVAQLGQYTDLRGKTVIDVGGGPGFFARALLLPMNHLLSEVQVSRVIDCVRGFFG